MITEMVNKQFSHLMIMGDFNYPGIDWEKLVSSGSVMEQEFLDTCTAVIASYGNMSHNQPGTEHYSLQTSWTL